MIQSNLPIFLASKSPRRKKLLKQLNISFRTLDIEVDETIYTGESPVRAVKRLSIDKLNEAKKHVLHCIIITADTIVVLDKKIIGKPINNINAKKILKKLSGKTHLVYTGFSIFNSVSGKTITDYEKTMVTFRKLGVNEIDDYIKTGSPMDKAGAYGIQDDFGAVFIKKINGCYYNVVGLPLPKLYQSLLKVV